MRTRWFFMLPFFSAVGALAAAGDILTSFVLPGQPAMGVRGLAVDWADGNIWVAAIQAQGDVRFAKFDAETRAVLTPWQPLPGANWQYDLGYGYRVGSIRYLVAVDNASPRYRLYTTAASYAGFLPEPFGSPTNAGIACDWNGQNVFASNYSFPYILRWASGEWVNWAAISAPLGLGFGWGRVFALSAGPPYRVYVYQHVTGSLLASFPLGGWPAGYYALGLSAGRTDAHGPEDSLFVASYYPTGVIFEVSAGDVGSEALAGVSATSAGRIKALYR